MSPLVWILIVVAFEILVFSLTVFLVRRFSHEHDVEAQAELEAPAERTPAQA